MQTKILAVVIVAALIACGLGFFLLKKDQGLQTDAVAQEAPAAKSVVPQPVQSTVPNMPVVASAPKDAPTAPDTPPRSTYNKIPPPAPSPNAPEPSMRGFENLRGLGRLQLLKTYLVLTPEQDVMAAAYYEALDKINEEQSRATMQRPPVPPGQFRGPQMFIQPQPLDERIADLEIQAQELKEVRDLRDQFIKSLTVPQKQKVQAYIDNGAL